jgi:protein-S-isoprenylcysteine O-methyltransferase Ste14
MAGLVILVAGAALAVACILTFVFAGKGTPAPFDPPRRLVAQGPYRLVRNPMYLGAALVLCGAALFYESIPLAAYAVLFLVITHLFVLFYEEPTLRQTFGNDYEVYSRRVGRWWPKRGTQVSGMLERTFGEHE